MVGVRNRIIAVLSTGLLALCVTVVHADEDWWQQVVPGVWGGASNGVVTELAEHQDSLYMGTYNVATGCEVWVNAPLTSKFRLQYKVAEEGFGDANNLAVLSMASFDSISSGLFVGTLNQVTGGEIWVTTGGDFSQTNVDGLGDSGNHGIQSMAVFDGNLYVGTSNSSGLVIHRFTGVTWTPVVTNSGFGNPHNTAALSMVVHDGALYVGTENVLDGGEIWRSTNGTAWSSYVLGGLGGSTHITALASAGGTLFAAVPAPASAGVRVFAVGNGFSIQVNTDGFGDPNIIWPSAMVTYRDTVYVGTGATANGAEVWRLNGLMDWTRVAENGFGVAGNTDAMCLAVYEDGLWAGTANWSTGGEVWRMVMIFSDGFESGDTSQWSATTP